MTSRERIWAEHEERIRARLETLDPDLARYIREFAYGEVYERTGLDLKTKQLLAVVMLVSLGNPDEIRTHLRGALRVGATEEELRETLLFAVPFLGFPRVVGAFAHLKDVLGKETAAPRSEGGAQNES